MMKPIFALAMASAFFASGVIVLNSNAADAGTRRDNFREQVKEKLGLTDDQVEDIKTTLLAEKDAIKDIMNRLHAVKSSLRDAIQKENAKEADVRAAAAKFAAVEADSAVLRSRLYGKINKTLTEEQRGKLKDLNANVDDFISKLIEKAGERLNLQ
jgi:Spy/CpxP family protein refolding chaperone